VEWVAFHFTINEYFFISLLIIFVNIIILIYYLFQNTAYDYFTILNSCDLDNYNGAGVKIAVLDSGLEEFNSLGLADTQILNFTSSNTIYDKNGHGTMMINIISNKNVGISPAAEVFSLKILNQDCKGNYLDTIKAIQWCMDNNIDIINLSIATAIDYPQLSEIIGKASKNGIIIISSLSNSFSKNNYPADYDNVIGIYTDYNMYQEKYYRVFCPFNEFYTKNKVEGCIGNSPATAYCSGIAARLIEKYTNNNIKYNNEMVFYELKKILERGTK
jgi:subtilisin family serine protease